MNAVTLPDNLPSVGNARLPEVYSQAKVALQECVKIDECQDWADKAEAMASYARQANDEAMHKMADRIQARAIRRCGELLQEIEPQQGGDQKSTGRDRPIGRAEAADNAGLSERQRKTALRVANVPGPEFETAVESDMPPTVTALAEQGIVRKPLVDLGNRKPEEFAEATRLLGLIAHIKRAGEKHWARAKNPEMLFKAIEAKITAQADYVCWRDGVVTAGQPKKNSLPKKRILPDADPGGRGKKQITVQKSALPAADPGAVTAHRWRKRFCHKGETGTIIDTAYTKAQAPVAERKAKLAVL